MKKISKASESESSSKVSEGESISKVSESECKSIPKVYECEYKFCLILWENEPISQSALAKICKEKLEWSRTTTYTVIKRLGDRGVVKNDNSIITSLVTKDEVQSYEVAELMEKRFNGSVPSFIAAFAKNCNLSQNEIDEIRKIIENGGN
jgi:predicted transcriptional regulator